MLVRWSRRAGGTRCCVETMPKTIADAPDEVFARVRGPCAARRRLACLEVWMAASSKPALPSFRRAVKSSSGCGARAVVVENASRASGCNTLASTAVAFEAARARNSISAALRASDLSSQSHLTGLARRNYAAAHATASFQSSPAVAVLYGRAPCRALAQRCHNGPPPPRPLAQPV